MADELTEYFDDEATFQASIHQLADHIRSAKHFVVFTGAGISTSAAIPDFRGPQGVWTRRDRGQTPPPCITMEEAKPTFTHRALLKLQQAGVMKYLVSQNVDGLHRRSGFAADQISELHGNCFLEYCPDCKADYLRDYDVTRVQETYAAALEDKLSQSGISHITGRRCVQCKKGMLRDSIIHFSENLPEVALRRAYANAERADVILCIGTSLRVSPACDIPFANRACKVYICNLQVTPKDNKALRSGGLLIRGRCDEFMAELCQQLNVAVDEATLANQDLRQPVTATPPLEPFAAQPLPDVVYIGNTHELVSSELADDDAESRNSHQWGIFVSTDPQDVTGRSEMARQMIDRVELALHPTFTPRTVVLQQAPFQLKRIGWGTFDVGVRVHFKEALRCAPLEVVHRLSFDGAGTVAAFSIPHLVA
eukprot:TRINITY_DN2109_c0_g2_i1.p1 TRINITY_DN2109_c0_g2~~TRINITY_DN2109_c0_g2_i1.p1  ORF type:complete len:424 (-),score=80.55 TRINITY_DN2109_c0_g2_i1:107-1378(-)